MIICWPPGDSEPNLNCQCYQFAQALPKAEM